MILEGCSQMLLEGCSQRMLEDCSQLIIDNCSEILLLPLLPLLQDAVTTADGCKASVTIRMLFSNDWKPSAVTNATKAVMSNMFVDNSLSSSKLILNLFGDSLSVSEAREPLAVKLTLIRAQTRLTVTS